MGKKHFGFFQTAETGKRAPNSGVKGSGANPVFHLTLSNMAQRHVAFYERHVAFHERHVTLLECHVALRVRHVVLLLFRQ